MHSVPARRVSAASGTSPRGADGFVRRPPLLAPGRNCWRIERATRLSFLIDGDEFFDALRRALANARKSIFIVGWDIDSRMHLVPGGAHDGFPEPLGDFLNALIAR